MAQSAMAFPIGSVTLDRPQAGRRGFRPQAREARYRLLANTAHALSADAIVTGHTLDDQIETVAMRADRSAEGAVGLAGMAPATLYAGRLWILRPYLRTRRNAIRSDLDGRGQRWIDDPSNEDLRYERIRVRQSAPAIEPSTIEEAAREREALSRRAAQWLIGSAEVFTGPVVAIKLSAGATLDMDVRDHALSTVIAILGGKSHRPAAASLARLAAALDTHEAISGSHCPAAWCCAGARTCFCCEKGAVFCRCRYRHRHYWFGMAAT